MRLSPLPRAGSAGLALSFALLMGSPALAQENPPAPGEMQQPMAGDPPPGGLPSDDDLRTAPGEAPLAEAEFDSLTRGKTFDTYDAASGLYGIETFLSGKRVIWRDSERCMHGTWEQVGEQICFMYEDHPDEPDCWTYFDRKDWLLGFYQGHEEFSPILLYPAKGLVTCETYLGT